MYISARAVTNALGHTIANGGEFIGAKTVDLTGKRQTVWDGKVTQWEEFDIERVLWLANQSNTYLKKHGLAWIKKFHTIAFYLTDKYSADEACKVGKTNARIISMIVGNIEYRARGCIIHERKIRETN